MELCNKILFLSIKDKLGQITLHGVNRKKNLVHLVYSCFLVFLKSKLNCDIQDEL